MLHEILLSLSGHPSPLLKDGHGPSTAHPILSPSERDLLRTAGHLSELHGDLIRYTQQIIASHPSVICRAVATSINSVHLGAFQRRILEVESEILRRDSGLVGAYDIVPLTAVMGKFSNWTRRLEWLWELVQFMLKDGQKRSGRTGAELMNKLRAELQTGYADIETTALSLIKTAEVAWLKQVSAWVLYGRTPTFGGDDFFIQNDDEDEYGYRIEVDLLPSFVASSTASSMLFIGVSLNRIRARSAGDTALGGLGHISSQLGELSSLTFPLGTAALSRAITSIRATLSRTTLSKLLPLEKVVEILRLLRQFLLLGRGEFAMALTHQADEKIRSRWRRADNLAYEKRGGLGTAVVKEGEVSGVLARTWAALGAMQSQHAEEDEELELARELLRLQLSKSRTETPAKAPSTTSSVNIVSTPFKNFLLSIPVELMVRTPSPIDLFLSTTDVQIYTTINSYLMSLRRAHLRLTDLWKVTSLRRHHPAPPRPPYSCTKGGIAKTRTLRERRAGRSLITRSAWTTSSAAVFFLAETEAYLQVEVVEGMWSHFHTWLSTGICPEKLSTGRPGTSAHRNTGPHDHTSQKGQVSGVVEPSSRTVHHDPQTLSVAHRLYLRVLTRRLLLTQSVFTDALYNLLIHVDRLVALISRLSAIWTSMDLETDEGVVDAFSNLESEEIEIKLNLREVEASVRNAIQEVIGVLRNLSMDSKFLTEMEEDNQSALQEEEYFGDEDEGRYVPKRIGSIDRLLMKLDFGGWFDNKQPGKMDASHEDEDI